MHVYRLSRIIVQTPHNIIIISAAVAIPSFSGIKHPPRAARVTRPRVKYVTRGPARA